MVFSFSTMATASLAAASGRQRNVISDSLMYFFTSTGSFLSSEGIFNNSISSLLSKRSNIRRPVVPSLPSIKTFFFITFSSCILSRTSFYPATMVNPFGHCVNQSFTYPIFASCHLQVCNNYPDRSVEIVPWKVDLHPVPLLWYSPVCHIPE